MRWREVQCSVKGQVREDLNAEKLLGSLHPHPHVSLEIKQNYEYNKQKKIQQNSHLSCVFLLHLKKYISLKWIAQGLLMP